MNRSTIKGKTSRKIITIILCIMMLTGLLPVAAEQNENDISEKTLTVDDVYVCLSGEDGLGELVPMHTVTSVGRENVKSAG